jgi:hypothetical protein
MNAYPTPSGGGLVATAHAALLLQLIAMTLMTDHAVTPEQRVRMAFGLRIVGNTCRKVPLEGTPAAMTGTENLPQRVVALEEPRGLPLQFTLRLFGFKTLSE